MWIIVDDYVSYCSHPIDRNTNKNTVREKRLLLVYGFRDYSRSWRDTLPPLKIKSVQSCVKDRRQQECVEEAPPSWWDRGQRAPARIKRGITFQVLRLTPSSTSQAPPPKSAIATTSLAPVTWVKSLNISVYPEMGCSSLPGPQSCHSRAVDLAGW